MSIPAQQAVRGVAATVLAFAALALLLLTATPAVAADEADTARPFVYNITTDDAWAGGMALAQASVAAGRGHPVTVFLNVRGVHLADRDARRPVFPPAGKTPAELMAGLIAGGHRVLVCGACMSVAGLTEADLIDGAVKSGAGLTFGALEQPGVLVLSY